MAEKEKKPVFRKNKPGRRIKTISPYVAFESFIMRKKNDACNQFSESIEITEAEKFIRRKRNEGFKGMGFLHLFIAAHVRMISQKPAINRYICGQRIYAAKEIVVVMTVKKTMSEDSEETSIKVAFDPSDTVEDVYRKMNAAIDEVKNGTETSTDKVANVLIKLPRFLLNFVVWFAGVLDYFNLFPKFLYDASPFHGSMIVTDVGSLGIQPIYHHIYNFGNLPVFYSFGKKRRVYEMNKDGQVEEKRYIDFTVVTDERICDGYTFAQGFKVLKSSLAHPETLDKAPEIVVEDIY